MRIFLLILLGVFYSKLALAQPWNLNGNGGGVPVAPTNISFLGTRNVQPLRFVTNQNLPQTPNPSQVANATRMYFHTDGRLGLGQGFGSIGAPFITPSSLLHLRLPGAVVVDQRFTNGTTGDLSADGYQVGILGNGAAELNQREDLPITFWTGSPGAPPPTANAERMRITELGRVGIGTANPQGQLHVNSAFDPLLRLTTGTGFLGTGNGPTDGFEMRYVS
jgi:hypothetical protein